VSFVFEIDGETVWSPALRAGQAFVGCAEALGKTFGADPGFSFNSEDMVEIDKGQLASFAEVLTQTLGRSAGHRVLTDLIDAVRIPCLVMIERAGLAVSGSHDPNTARSIVDIGATMPQ
jgi:hypothetical protein